jgi:carboxylesterase type B
MISRSLFFCVFLLSTGLGLSALVARSDAPTATTGDANYVGFTDAKYNVDIWTGIRFAKPPLGPLRLQPPQPYEASGTIPSQVYGDRCFEIGNGAYPDPFNKTGNNSEDCLFLNVYAPPQSSTRKRWLNTSPPWPVMVYLFGGGFGQGSANDYKGQSLVNHSVELESPIIVVTVNYRLGFFGFQGKSPTVFYLRKLNLAAGTDAIANNALNLGLHDQRLGMQWVHDNIAAFGGDPDKVTLFGQSAGASSVGLQMLAYNGADQKLFRAAILESGSASDNIIPPLPTWHQYQGAWDYVAAGVGYAINLNRRHLLNVARCNTSANVFQCVQAAENKLLYTVVNEVAALSPLPLDIWP